MQQNLLADRVRKAVSGKEINTGHMSTYHSFVLGFRSSTGYFVSTFLFGIMFGIVAGSVDLYYWQTLLMSFSTYSASAQFVALEFWVEPLPIATIGLSVLLVSTRNILLGMSMAHAFDRHSLLKRILWLFLLNDPGVVTSYSQDKAVDRLGYVTGYGLSLMISWLMSISLGFLLSDLFAQTDLGALNFAGPLVMATMLILFAKGSNARPLPWMVSGLIAIVLFELGASDYLTLLLSVICGVLVAIITSRRSHG